LPNPGPLAARARAPAAAAPSVAVAAAAFVVAPRPLAVALALAVVAALALDIAVALALAAALALDIAVAPAGVAVVAPAFAVARVTPAIPSFATKEGGFFVAAYISIIMNDMSVLMNLASSLSLVLFLAFEAAAAAQEPPPEPAPPPPEVAPPPADVAPAPPEPPLAGWHQGLFYLRDESDTFRLYVQGRVHTDGVTWFGPGVGSLGPSYALKTTFYLRRARPEIAGEFFHDWQWQLGVDLAPSAQDNPWGTTDSLNCAVNPTTSAQTCTPQTNPVEAPIQRPAPTDAFVNYGPSPWANLQVGQFLFPVTMEARISDNTTPFLERSLVARALGAPNTRDIGAMAWGESPDRVVYYSIGVFNGDGPNRSNADDRFDFAGRAFARPFHGRGPKDLDWAEVGVSGRYGSRDPRLVGYDEPAFTTQENYAFWKPTYRDSLGRILHIIPSSDQWALGADVYVPVDGFDVTAEFIYASSNTREAIDGYQLSPFTERLGVLKGYAYYVTFGYWLVGSRDIIGYPSYGRPLHADLAAVDRAPARGLQALARFEQLHVSYDGASRGGALDPLTPNGDIDVTEVTLGLNYWATRHLRVGVNYGFYDFPSSAPVTASEPGGPVQTSAQRAMAPAQTLAKGADDAARDGGHTLDELSVRFGVQF
jgi:phosphate-selective porin OprO and OprP